MLPEVASLPPEDELDPLDEVVELDEVLDELEEPEPLELDVLLAVGVDEEVVSVSVEVPESELVLELFVEEDEEDEEDVPLLVPLCAALGTVAATASDPAMPLAATIAVIVAVRALPCRTERAAPSASMDVSVKGCYRSVTPKMPAPDEKIINTSWGLADIRGPRHRRRSAEVQGRRVELRSRVRTETGRKNATAIHADADPALAIPSAVAAGGYAPSEGGIGGCGSVGNAGGLVEIGRAHV